MENETLMKMQSVTIKLGTIALISLALNACSMLPSADGIFIDEKENYKKAHQLPELELPPELLSGQQKNEYDGGAKGTAAIADQYAQLETTPLNDEQAKVELLGEGENSHLLIRDTLRNAWRKTVSALDTLDYDIEDKNRQSSMVYLNIEKEVESESMLSGLTFWSSTETIVYIVELKQVDEGVTVSVLDEEQQPISDAVSAEMLSRLLTELDS